MTNLQKLKQALFHLGDISSDSAKAAESLVVEVVESLEEQQAALYPRDLAAEFLAKEEKG